MRFRSELSELLENGVITEETLKKINDYYYQKNQNSSNRLILVFAILGAILIGLGIILIVAHNWDNLSRLVKTIFAFLPLVIGYLLLAFVLLKKKNASSWKESVAAFLFFAVGACIALVSQIYNIPGNLESYMLTWMLLVLPLIYIANSSIVSLMYIAGITYYGNMAGYWNYSHLESYWYWLLFLGVLPYYYYLIKNKPTSNFTVFHHWLISLSLTIVLGTIAKSNESLMFVSYMSLFGLFYLIGNLDFFKNQTLFRNAYLMVGTLGSIILLLITSFNFFWEDLIKEKFVPIKVLISPEFISVVVLTGLGIYLLFHHFKNKTLDLLKPVNYIFIIFLMLYFLGFYFDFLAIFINLMIFALGILTIFEGNKKEHLGLLNFGLLIITSLVICRFFDTNLSFVVRGILFVLVGIGFFIANYKIIQKKQSHDQ